MKKYKIIFAAMLISFSSMLILGNDIRRIESTMLAAYSGGQYNLARNLSAKCQGSIKARLVSALCDVYDLKNQNLSRGLSGLKNIYADASAEPAVRSRAGLAYARAAQALNMRDGLYSVVSDIDYDKIYLDIIKSYPASSSAAFAAAYLTQEWFESTDRKDVSRAFALLKKFTDDYKGNQSFLSPLHCMLADQYIIHGGQYALAVKELELAVKGGLFSPRISEDTVYRIARIYDTRLHDRANAVIWYKRFIRQYSGSSKAVLAKRYLGRTEVKK